MLRRCIIKLLLLWGIILLFKTNLNHIIEQLQSTEPVTNYSVIQSRLERMTDQYYHELEQNRKTVVQKGQKRIIRSIAKYENL